ncbi:MAG: T9SS type A sorting domain-containing protein [Flavobacteriales bacterium]|nr:T9SS type A sorting domain-containing protein [Flavobacteriales bacterium]
MRSPSGYVSDDTDCDDTDASINPDATEVCDNGVDDDCDGNIDNVATNTYYADADGDGYGDASISTDACTAPSGYVSDDTDCDDTDASINPDATEVCDNGADDDCDGNIDNAAANSYFADTDGDGYGDPSDSVVACTAPSGYVGDDTDCDDTDASINPGADEVCNNGADDNCDGNTDELPLITFYADADGDGYGDASNSVQDCTLPTGYVTDDSDCDDTDENVNPGATEVCDNSTDDDCDGNIDNVAANTYYADADGDGYGDASTSTTACTAPSGYVTDSTDCDDADASVNPGTDEVCNNGVDDNCSGAIDELALATYYMDADGDGYGDPSSSVDDCEQPSGYVADGTDCDDTNADVYPGATEVCNEVDDDCDSTTDEDIVFVMYYADGDGDGYGDPAVTMESCVNMAGYVTDNTDCDDADSSVNPGATEVCDDTDNDCDGSIDEELTLTTYYTDADGDGYGTDLLGDFCSPPANSSTVGGDCDDANSSVNPGESESCDGIDNDCDAEIDDNVVYLDYYEDLDGDGFGAAFLGNLCLAPTNGVTTDGDCDDANSAINPDALETCNDLDDNCNEGIDEGLTFADYYSDDDGDGYGDELLGSFCSAPANSSVESGDCDDSNASINPGASEFCNEIDDNCDESIDNDVVYVDYYSDVDGDGFGGDFLGNFCSPPANAVTNADDCDDTDSGIHPNAPEFCDNTDNDCDGAIDEGLATSTYYADNDGDAVGGDLLGDFCSAPANSSLISGDCNDNDANVYPGATELCNSEDDNCDGSVDEGVLLSFYADEDADGYGDLTALVLACSSPVGYVENSEDCDDTDEDINPDAIEFCDGIDNDCNDAIDDNCIDNVEEVNISWSVKLYPNPAHAQLSVTVVGVSGSLEYAIHDAMGRLVVSSKINGSNAVNNIDISQLSQGSYSISVHNGTEKVIRKFVKL